MTVLGIESQNKDVEQLAVEFAVGLGRMIRSARKKKDLTQAELSQMLGTSQQCVSFWENGKQLPSVFSLIRIACALDLELKISLGGE